MQSKQFPLFSMMRRNNIDIISKILKECLEKINTTMLMQKCGLSYSQFKFYMVRLEQSGLVKLDQAHYYTTEKGKTVIKSYERLLELLE